jgi:SAM-dependent methyltransferase
VFHKLVGAPTNSVVLLQTREEALDYPKGDISLAHCRACGFITNIGYDASMLEYSPRYEATQSYSPTFDAFARRLAARLVTEYDLHDKDVIEIGCGQGEFLKMICELGGNRGVGFDPVYVGGLASSLARDRLTFISDYYSEQYAGYRADFVCCKMTLEHVPDVADFVNMVRRSLDRQSNTVVFFQVPDVTRILREYAFWDIYYEHCSYFSPGSLARLFRDCGFEVLKLAREYDDQYVMIEARPASGTALGRFSLEDDLEEVAHDVAKFSECCGERIADWRSRIGELWRGGAKVVLWGGGSKAVAFLTTLSLQDEIEYVVDINPNKQGTFIAGTGQAIVGPEFLPTSPPDVVIVMNPIYCYEIQRDLDRLGLSARILEVTVSPGAPPSIA